jgi:class I fructose-bisphosphate aldolase
MILRKRFNLRKILKKGRAMFLAYDQGMEHGPMDFNDKNVNPEYIIGIAKAGGFTGLIFQKGIAEKYNSEIKKSGVPLIVKLNGKTSLVKGEPISRQLCLVDEAIELGAVAVGYTIYIGSEHEEEMFQEFVEIQKEAHKKGLPVIAWIYPRGKGIRGKKKGELLAYAARIGLEIGADIVKIHSHGNKNDLDWAVRSAGKARIVIAGGSKKDEKDLLKEVRDAMTVGASGIAIGRNVWQAKKPLVLAKKLKGVIWR